VPDNRVRPKHPAKSFATRHSLPFNQSPFANRYSLPFWGFYHRRFCHDRYCLVVLDFADTQVAEFVRNGAALRRRPVRFTEG
jgi:hypothetical protein